MPAEHSGDSPKEIRQEGREDRRSARALERNDRRETRREAPDVRKTERKVDRWDGSAEAQEREEIFNKAADIKRKIQVQLLSTKPEDYPVYEPREDHVTGSAGAEKYRFKGEDWGNYYKVIEQGNGEWKGGDPALLQSLKEYEEIYKQFKHASINWEDRDGLRKFENKINRPYSKEENRWELFEKWVNRFMVVQNYRREQGESGYITHQDIYARTPEQRRVLEAEIQNPDSELDQWADNLVKSGYTAFDLIKGVHGAVNCCPNPEKRKALLEGLRRGDPAILATLASIGESLSQRVSVLEAAKKAQDEFADSTDFPEKIVNSLHRAVGDLSDPQNLVTLAAGIGGLIYLWRSSDQQVNSPMDYVKKISAFVAMGYSGYIVGKRGIWDPMKEAQEEGGLTTKESQQTKAVLDSVSNKQGDNLMSLIGMKSYKLASVMEWGIRSNDTQTIERHLQNELISAGADPKAIGIFDGKGTWEGLTKILENIGEKAGIQASQFANKKEYLLACTDEMRKYGSQSLMALLLQVEDQDGSRKAIYGPSQRIEISPETEKIANEVAAYMRAGGVEAEVHAVSPTQVKIDGLLFQVEPTSTGLNLKPTMDSTAMSLSKQGENQKIEAQLLAEKAKSEFLKMIKVHLPNLESDNLVYRNSRYEMISPIPASNTALAQDLGLDTQEVRASFTQDNASSLLVIQTADGSSFKETELNGKSLVDMVTEKTFQAEAIKILQKEKPELTLGLSVNPESLRYTQGKAVLTARIGDAPAVFSFKNGSVEAWNITATQALQTTIQAYAKSQGEKLEGGSPALAIFQKEYEMAYGKALLDHIAKQTPLSPNLRSDAQARLKAQEESDLKTSLQYLENPQARDLLEKSYDILESFDLEGLDSMSDATLIKMLVMILEKFNNGDPTKSQQMIAAIQGLEEKAIERQEADPYTIDAVVLIKDLEEALTPF